MTENAHQNTREKSPLTEMRSRLNKALVVLLCVISFFAGWQAYKSCQIDACLDLGGQVLENSGALVCRLSP